MNEERDDISDIINKPRPSPILGPSAFTQKPIKRSEVLRSRLQISINQTMIKNFITDYINDNKVQFLKNDPIYKDENKYLPAKEKHKIKANVSHGSTYIALSIVIETVIHDIMWSAIKETKKNDMSFDQITYDDILKTILQTKDLCENYKIYVDKFNDEDEYIKRLQKDFRSVKDNSFIQSYINNYIKSDNALKLSDDFMIDNKGVQLIGCIVWYVLLDIMKIVSCIVEYIQKGQIKPAMIRIACKIFSKTLCDKLKIKLESSEAIFAQYQKEQKQQKELINQDDSITPILSNQSTESYNEDSDDNDNGSIETDDDENNDTICDTVCDTKSKKTNSKQNIRSIKTIDSDAESSNNTNNNIPSKSNNRVIISDNDHYSYTSDTDDDDDDENESKLQQL